MARRIIFPELDTVPEKRDCVGVYFYRGGYWTTLNDDLISEEYGEGRVIVAFEFDGDRPVPAGRDGEEFGSLGWTNIGIGVLERHGVDTSAKLLLRNVVPFGKLAHALYKAGRIWFEKSTDYCGEGEIQAFYGREKHFYEVLDNFYQTNR